MKLRVKLTTAIFSLLLVLGLTIVGVLAASQGTVNLGGTVSFVAKDVQAIVTGEITGTAVGDDISLTTLKYSATEEPTDNQLKTWEDKELNFANKNSKIVIAVTVENLNIERSLYVDVAGEVGETSTNIVKTLTKDGNVYKSGEIIEVKPSTGEGTSKVTINIEITIKNKNYSVNKAGFDYVITLNNDMVGNMQNDKYNVNCNFSSEDGEEYSNMFKTDSAPIEGDNVYQVNVDTEPCAYIVTNHDISSEIKAGTNLSVKIYISDMCEIVIKVNGNEIDANYSTEDMYGIYSFEHNVASNLDIEVIGVLYMII